MAKSETDSRQARLAAALRDNLKRRKAQGRARKVAVSGQGFHEGSDSPMAGTGGQGTPAPGPHDDSATHFHGAGGQHPVKED
ncbi:hypothetical protein [Chelatococcus asaccharovorans]|uniref:hypothetical protein n=1 Tax=Chelatococcus asaccharovorans TaxID=28210 RepID=UPI00224C7746|nr:hypothetical protein [Chelatococcus asaccharovorans]CAH1650233.1 conserved hypothetical protein [Chelatococcus asaccharovorans]CAH1686794.1 conserved hypothetical protein [Chelatococcus asaccharovorans]